MELKKLKSELSAAVEKYNGKQVGVGEARIDFMAHDCFNAIVDLEKQIAALKSERDVAVRALEIVFAEFGYTLPQSMNYYIQQAKGDLQK
jgi:hypothetical protein